VSDGLILDVRDRAAFLRGHAPGAAHLPVAEWAERAAELPPREDPFLVVAEDEAATAAAVALLHARGSTQARPAPPAVAADRSESGPPRRLAWRAPAWLTACLAAAALPPGARSLDVACGSGRVVAALAAHGLSATGVDLLPDALGRARRLAAAAGVHASFIVADAEQRLPFRPASFRLVTGFRYLDRSLFSALAALLEPGGELWWETFGVEQARFGHPRRAAFLLAPGELAALCADAGLTILATSETCPPGGPALSGVRAQRPMGAPLR
jgi:SAM-dependent methyltransferase